MRGVWRRREGLGSGLAAIVLPTFLSDARGNKVMVKRLSDDDRRAVDLLLERPNGVGDTPSVEQLFRAPVQGSFERRLEAAEKLLSLLDEMPTEEPPPQLVARTLQRIRELELEPTAPTDATIATTRAAVAGDARPHA